MCLPTLPKVQALQSDETAPLQQQIQSTGRKSLDPQTLTSQLADGNWVGGFIEYQ